MSQKIWPLNRVIWNSPKIIFYLLALCAFGSVKSASLFSFGYTSYNLADYTQSIIGNVDKKYGLHVPDHIANLLLEFVPSNKYQTSKVYLANWSREDISNKHLILKQDYKEIKLIYDEKQQRHYFWIHQSPTSLPIQLYYKIEEKGIGGNIVPIEVSEKIDKFTLPLSAWYKEALEKKNAQNPPKKITLDKYKVCIYNDNGQLSINLDDPEKHIGEETIYIHPECTTQEIIDSIVLHLRNQSEDSPHPLFMLDISQPEVTAEQPFYFTLLPSDVPRSASRDAGNDSKDSLMRNECATVIMESYEESLYDVLKKKESESELGCCEKMQKHKNTIAVSLLSITVAGLAYYANFSQGF